MLLSEDIQVNPGPKSKTSPELSFYHWNLNNIAAHNFSKIPLLIAYNAIPKFDIIFISETYLDASIYSDDENFSIPGCSLTKANHPGNVKRAGICIYYKS